MKPITILLPEQTPMLAIARFAAELGCDTDISPLTGVWIFTQARDPLPPVDVAALKEELYEMRRQYVELSRAVNNVVRDYDEIKSRDTRGINNGERV